MGGMMKGPYTTSAHIPSLWKYIRLSLLLQLCNLCDPAFLFPILPSSREYGDRRKHAMA